MIIVGWDVQVNINNDVYDTPKIMSIYNLSFYILQGGWEDFDPCYGQSHHKTIYVYIHDRKVLQERMEEALRNNNKISWICGFNHNEKPSAENIQSLRNEQTDAGNLWKLWWFRV